MLPALQDAIVKESEIGASRRVFDLQLDQLGPYCLGFNRSGRHLLLGGRKGHLALLDWQQARPLVEVQVTHQVQSSGQGGRMSYPPMSWGMSTRAAGKPQHKC